MKSSSRSTKVLAPLAVLLAAGALAVGSGATFSSTTGNTISSVTAGDLELTNSKDGQAVFTLTNMKPGDVLTGSLALTNTGSLPAAVTFTESASTNTFSADMLTLVITDSAGTDVYDGNFGDLADTAKEDLGVFQPAQSETYTFTVALDENATNDEQGKAASATYTWDAVQLKGQTFNR
jgi:spore coat-associated protein N